MRFCFRIVVLGLISCVAFAQGQADAFQQWLATAAHPLAAIDSEDVRDLKPLVEMAGHARVVGFGETAHQTHELQLLRLRALRALAKTKQVRALTMEAGYVETLPVNDWLVGTSSAKPDFDAAFPFNDEGKLSELHAALEWLHSFNQTLPPVHRIRFYGLDLPSGGGAMRPALDYVWSYLGPIDPALVSRSRASMSDALTKLGEGWPNGAKQRFDSLDGNSKSALVYGIDELEKSFDSKRREYASSSGSEQFERARHAVTIARETLTFMQDPQDGSNPRDQALAANLQWTLEHVARDGVVVVWAHNAHVQKQAIEVAGAPMKPAVSMGQILGERMGDRYLAIGTTADRLAMDGAETATPAKATTVDNVLSSLVVNGAGVPSYFVDLRPVPRTGGAAVWLNSTHEMRFQDTYLRVTPAKAFDAFFFVAQVSPAIRLAEPKK